MNQISFWNGICEVVNNIICGIIETADGWFLTIISFDFPTLFETAGERNYLTSFFPFLPKLMVLAVIIGGALLFLVVILQLVKGMMGPFAEADRPGRILGRGLLFGVLVCLLPTILHELLKPVSYIWGAVGGEGSAAVDEVIETAQFLDLFRGDGSFLRRALFAIGHPMDTLRTKLIELILSTILVIAIFWNYFKLLLLTLERWVQLAVLYFTAPIAASFGASATTSKIFTSWTRVMCSAVFLLISNLFFLFVFKSAVAYLVTHGPTWQIAGGASTEAVGFVTWCVVCLAILRVGQRMEGILNSIGVNVAQTGAGLIADIAGTGGALLMAARSIAGISRGLGANAARAKAATARGTNTSEYNTTAQAQKVANNNANVLLAQQKANGTASQDATVQSASQRADGSGFTMRTTSASNGEIIQDVYNNLDDLKAEHGQDAPYSTIAVEVDGKADRAYAFTTALQTPMISTASDLSTSFSPGTINRIMDGESIINTRITPLKGGGFNASNASDGTYRTVLPKSTYQGAFANSETEIITDSAGREYYMSQRMVDMSMLGDDGARNIASELRTQKHAKGSLIDREYQSSSYTVSGNSIVQTGTLENGQGEILVYTQRTGYTGSTEGKETHFDNAGREWIVERNVNANAIPYAQPKQIGVTAEESRAAKSKRQEYGREVWERRSHAPALSMPKPSAKKAAQPVAEHTKA